MNKQQSISFINDELKEVKTHKREFLKRIEEIMPWGELEELVRPCYYEGKRGNKPYGLELMLRIHLLQNLYNLSDEGTRNEIIDSRAFSDFCEVESSNQIPDGDTIGRFRNKLIENGVHEKFFAIVVKTITDRGLILKKERSLTPPSSKHRPLPKTKRSNGIRMRIRRKKETSGTSDIRHISVWIRTPDLCIP